MKAALALVAALAAGSSRAATVEGPVTGGRGSPFVATTTIDLGAQGYEQAEYFVGGTASAYTAAGPLESDGHWTAVPAESAPYKARVVVYRPTDRRRFNGTVVVEWLNVSGIVDAAGDWITSHTEMIREGYAYVGVSAQQIGIEGGVSVLGYPFFGLKTADPARYGSLSHPGDSFSYDIFSQAGQVVRSGGLLGELHVKRVIATGYSQSAHRLVTYVNAIHPLARVYDGYLLHARPIGAMPLSQSPQPMIALPTVAYLRDDLDARVLIFQSESDLVILAALVDRQPDSARVRTWEVAGTAHVDTYTEMTGAADLGDSPDSATIVLTKTPRRGIACDRPVNSGPHHFVYNAAIAALDRWLRTGKAPRSAPRLETDAGPPAAIRRDAHGNALGGIRTPAVDVPLAALSGVGNSPGFSCRLFGTTAPFDAATLADLYPDRKLYVAAVRKATARAVRRGWVRPADAKLLRGAAAGASLEGAPQPTRH